MILSNLIGAGLGPQVVGLLSDGFHAWGDPQNLQHALAAVALVNLVTAGLFLTRFDLRVDALTPTLMKAH